MKNKVCVSLLAAFAFLLFGHVDSAAQTNKTIVLVRHAEKMPPVDTDKGDPDLSAEGKQRAERLAKVLKKYKPHEIFATDYKRTKQTVEPIAKMRKKEIQTYDPTKQADLVAKIMPTKTDHYLIVGHSNTIPALANLLAKKELFRNLLDTEYGVFWVIRMKNGAITKVEMFPY
ncbi:MAG: phosphoglycerate mutase family protein [Pyrinomonadaceae bacterium]